MSLKSSLLILAFCILAYSLSVFYSAKNRSERDFNAMLDSGSNNLSVIENFLKQHNQKTDLDYDKALQLAASLDAKYLDEIIHYYAIGNLIFDTKTARIILRQIPSDSVKLNYAAGQIYASNEFNLHNPHKAVTHLEFAAMRGDRNAAASLSKMYTQSNCYIEAITWAKQANKRASSSECTKLPVNINLLSEKQYDAVIYNEDELKAAEKNNRLPELHYSEQCPLNKQ